MIISYKYRFIFVHVNKCAGTSITRALFPYLGPDDLVLGCLPEQEILHAESRKRGCLSKHSTASHIKSMIDADIWRNYFKFAFVRNPWDLSVSRYYWAVNTGWNDGEGRIEAIKQMSDFEEYVLSPLFNRKNCIDFLLDENRRIAVDFIGRYENLYEDYNKILDATGIPDNRLEKHNFTKHANYREYYNPLLVELVEEWFGKDISYFGYQF